MIEKKNLYKKTDKKRLYWLIDSFLLKEIDGRTFCEEFYYSYGLEFNSLNLTFFEEKIFNSLSEVSERFSEFSEDHQNYPKFFYTEKQLREKVTEVKKKLNKTLADIIDEELGVYNPSIEKSATILDDTWLMCPDCIDAWESTSKNPMVICPKCDQVLHNPRWKESNSN